ncbi:MAG: DUF6152 family protein, partial [Vicinamibacterales bacterium]
MRTPLLDRYTAPNPNFVLVVNPYSGPRRAERAKKILPTSQGQSSPGYLRAGPWLVTAAGLIVLAAGAPLAAHHSFAAEFDGSKPVTLTGTVTKMDWINPHAWLHVDVKGPDGKVVSWAVEGG